MTHRLLDAHFIRFVKPFSPVTRSTFSCLSAERIALIFISEFRDRRDGRSAGVRICLKNCSRILKLPPAPFRRFRSLFRGVFYTPASCVIQKAQSVKYLVHITAIMRSSSCFDRQDVSRGRSALRLASRVLSCTCAHGLRSYIRALNARRNFTFLFTHRISRYIKLPQVLPTTRAHYITLYPLY